MSTLTFDQAQFGDRRMRPVHAEFDGHDFHSNGIAWEDYMRGMQTRERKLAANRREPPPDWAFNDSKLRAVILRSMELRAYTHLKYKPEGTDAQRLAYAQKALKERQPALEAVLAGLCKQYVEAKQAGNIQFMQYLAPKVEETDTQLRLTVNAPAILTGVVYHYWRCGLDSVATAQQLGLKPPHVRQLLWRLKVAAGQLGYGPVMKVEHRQDSKVVAQRLERGMYKAAKEISDLLCKGKTWEQARAAVGDTSKHNHAARYLLKHFGLPCKSQGCGWRADKNAALEMARLREQGLTFKQIAAQLGLKSSSGVQNRLCKYGLWIRTRKRSPNS